MDVECGSALIVCGSGSGSIKYGECGYRSRTIKSPNFSKHLLISKSQNTFHFKVWTLKIKNIISCIICRAFCFLFLREKNCWLNSWFPLFCGIMIHRPKWMQIQPIRIHIFGFIYTVLYYSALTAQYLRSWTYIHWIWKLHRTPFYMFFRYLLQSCKSSQNGRNFAV